MEHETVTVVFKETGSTIGIMSRKDAEDMVAKDPDLFVIRETPNADLLKTLGAVGATHLLVETVAMLDAKARSSMQETAFQAGRQKGLKKKETKATIEAPVPAQRDHSPPRAPASVLQLPSGCDAFIRSGLEFVVGQYLQHDNFRLLFGDFYVSAWTLTPPESQSFAKYQFTAKNSRAANHIADTLRGLGYANATPKKSRIVH